MFSNIEKKLKMMRPKPITQAEKKVLWSKIESHIEGGQKQHFYFWQPTMVFGLSRRFAFASFLIFALIGGSVATAAASDSAKPGDILFPIDTAIEKIQLVFTTGKNKNMLRIKFAEERLNEVKIILALAESDDSDDATSTDDLMATSTADSDTEEKKPKKFNSKSIEKAENALAIALEYLEQTKGSLGEKGNNVAVLAVDGVIEELTSLAEDHVSDLDKFKIKIKDNGNKLKIDIKISSDNLKTKFKFGYKQEKIIICHVPPGDPDNPQTIEVASASAQAHLAHGDTLGACNGEDEDENGDTATSTPDITAPVISNLASSAATTTADIGWDTDEPSNSKAWYSTTTPLVISEAAWFVSSTDLVTNHNLSLLGLTASTTYYFIVASADAAGNSATSIESSFTTVAEETQEPVDTTSPTLTDVMATSTTATSTMISWKTDETATGKVWYGLSTPLAISTSTPMVENFAFVLNHFLPLAELTASSTYYFIVASTDQSGNTATSTESSFITLPE